MSSAGSMITPLLGYMSCCPGIGRGPSPTPPLPDPTRPRCSPDAYDEDGFYMVLEWVPHSLVGWIEQRGATQWTEFYASIGRPVLDALAFSQGRNWSHRDIKPSNILITDAGVPKISDYGIAKQFEKPSLGATFITFRSAPFTPPEDDIEEWRCSRD